MSKFHIWTDPGRCSTCKYCGMDMEMDPYCSHPEVLVHHRWGLNLNKAISTFCGEDLRLRVPREESGQSQEKSEEKPEEVEKVGVEKVADTERDAGRETGN